jgi:hypothetical protein
MSQEFEQYAKWHEREKTRLRAEAAARRKAFLEKPIKRYVIGTSPYLRAALVQADDETFDTFLKGPVFGIVSGALVAGAAIAVVGTNPDAADKAAQLGQMMGGMFTFAVGAVLGMETFERLGSRHFARAKLVTAADFIRDSGQDPEDILKQAAAMGRGLDDRIRAHLGGVTLDRMEPQPNPTAPAPAAQAPVSGRDGQRAAVQAMRNALKPGSNNTP